MSLKFKKLQNSNDDSTAFGHHQLRSSIVTDYTHDLNPGKDCPRYDVVREYADMQPKY